MNTSFRRPLSVLREQAGGYANGLYTAPAAVAETIQASVQPASGSDMDRIRRLPGGEALVAGIRIYTDAVLAVGDPSRRGDAVLYAAEGEAAPRTYRVTARQSWQGGLRVDYHCYWAVLENA